ncbi:mucin 2, oligomeric mucus/gel-forming [Rhizoctonia solani AG-1 IB]|uniref:Mucin 2, oligomeric mucus/gel-forming n=1 Tax=Thanatephorus cucumeris (strain AG1-IB / isolate 7/3/14) TaxID=1108050 RepID=A0A0B7FB21_THACB|nr:mucin 2, oligomeric mucus/gel-forming [Rhizoctonia solani AG-1 IB]
MKFSSPANIALASIALSSPSLLSSPVFANAAPTMDNPSLSPNPGTGYFGSSPQMHVTDSPVMPTMTSPPTSRIAGRRRSLRRSSSIRHRTGERSNRNIDPLGLGMSTRNVQPEAEFIRPRMAPVGSLTGTPGTIDPFSPIVGPGGLLTNTGLVPPNTPMSGGVPLSNGVDLSLLPDTVHQVAPTSVVDNVIPIIPNSVSSVVPGAVLPSLRSPVSLPQGPGALIQDLGNPSQIVGQISPLTGALSLVPGAVPQATGQVVNILPQVPGALPVPDPNRLAPPAIVPNFAASPNVALPPIPGALPDPVPDVSQLPGGVLQVPNPISRVPGAITQTRGAVPQDSGVVSPVLGGTTGIPQVPGAVAQVVPHVPVDSLSKAGAGLPVPNLAGGTPVPVGSELPLASPALPVTGLVAPTGLAVLSTSLGSSPSVALPTSMSSKHTQPILTPHSSAPSATVTNVLAEPIELLAPPDPLAASADLVPHILVSSPEEIGMFEPSEGIGAGAMGRPGGHGARADNLSSEKGDGARPKGSGEFDERGSSGEGRGSQTISVTESVMESRTTSWSATQSERPVVDRKTGELVPTNLARPSAKLEVPTTTEFLTPKPIATEARIAVSPEPTLQDPRLLSVRKRWESKSAKTSNDVGSSVIDEYGNSLLSEGVPPVPTSPVYVPPATRLGVPSHETLGVSRSASMVTLKSFSMMSISESPAHTPTPAQSVAQVISGINSSMAMAQPTGLAPTFSDDSLSSHSSEDEHPLLAPLISSVVASSPIPTMYTGGAPLGRTLERSADTPPSTVAINRDSPNVPSPTVFSSGTYTGSLDTATRKIFRWGVPKMVTSTIRSVATAVKK